ncbi:hypothetical protein Aph01nite_06700 [Acrocarpospora phusangensis]|uniref:Uncharacterized protein n=1 Tax=Acrocarpospora phusangensis TaxID=1070424 RepID=A0A919Q8X2_9ACTN|nr:hypothetical protein [Acrocarpospora phusangensis]GIH22360.1 hypothetical protein Aph01nite_06700 [Acrocarpospora phusangensis]
MDFWRTLLRLVRRKSIGPPLIVLAVAAAVTAWFLVPARYMSTASMVLATPAAGGTLPSDPSKPQGLTNPLLQFNDGLRTTAGILILAMNGLDVRTQVGVVKGGPTEMIVDDGRSNPDLMGISTSGPFIYLEVESDTPARVLDTTKRAQQYIRDELTKRQQALRAPKSTYIWIVDVVPASTPEILLTSKIMAVGGALGGTLVLGFGLVYVVTQLRATRRRYPEPIKPAYRPAFRPAIAPATPIKPVNGSDSKWRTKAGDSLDNDDLVVVVYSNADDSDGAPAEDTQTFKVVSVEDEPALRVNGGLSDRAAN